MKNADHCRDHKCTVDPGEEKRCTVITCNCTSEDEKQGNVCKKEEEANGSEICMQR